ncbi:MAG: hypothetical protein MO846_03025 [Candidatus Devosia symbiotica]|nr:hypothetical protein [Candidatus Devosia symbiotica]
MSDYLGFYDTNRSQQVHLLIGKVEERLVSLDRQGDDLKTTISELREI